MSIMLCGLRLVWRKFCSEILFDLSIRYQYQGYPKLILLRLLKCVNHFLIIGI